MILLPIHKRIPSLKRRNPNEQVWKVHRNLFSIMMMVFLSNRYVCVFCSITFSVLMLFVCLNKGEKHPRFIRLFISMASIEYFLQRNFCLSIFGQSTFLTWEMVLFLSLSLSRTITFDSYCFQTTMYRHSYKQIRSIVFAWSSIGLIAFHCLLSSYAWAKKKQKMNFEYSKIINYYFLVT